MSHLAISSLMLRGARLLADAPGNSTDCASAVDVEPMPPWELALRIVACAFLLALSALFAGLTLGVMGLDTNQLEIVCAAGSPRDQRNAAVILPVRRSGNLLLCTLLLGNVAVNSLSSILMADLTSGMIGFLASTFLIVILGEIVPQALCSRHALSLGARFVPVVRIFIVLTYPISKPISMILDYALGEEIGKYYSKQEFHKLLMMHMHQNTLNASEVAIMHGALSYRDKQVQHIMTPASRMFAVKSSDRLDYNLMAQIFRAGYSRVPVWSDDLTRIVGLLYSKDLMLIEPRACTPVITVVYFFNRQHINVVDEEDRLDAVLRIFSQTRQHFAIVRTVDNSGEGDPTYKIAGVVSMEDIVEEIIGAEIVDEYDAFRSSQHALHPATDTSTQPLLHQNGLHPVDTAAPQRAEAAIYRLHEATAAAAGVVESDGRGINNDLTPAEIDGIAAHLLTNVAAFRAAAAPADAASTGLTFETAQLLVQHCRIVEVTRTPPPPPSGIITRQPAPPAKDATPLSASDAAFIASQAPSQFGKALTRPMLGRPMTSAAEDADDRLYVRGEASTVCTVILEGRVELRVGQDELRMNMGPWDVLGERALTAADGYSPDFTVRPITDVVRCLRIAREDFDAARTGTLSFRIHMTSEQARLYEAMPGSFAAMANADDALNTELPDPLRKNTSMPPAGLLAETSAARLSRGVSAVTDGRRPTAFSLTGAAYRQVSVDDWIAARSTTLPPQPFSQIADAALPPLPPAPRHAQSRPPVVPAGVRRAPSGPGSPTVTSPGGATATQPQVAAGAVHTAQQGVVSAGLVTSGFTTLVEEDQA